MKGGGRALSLVLCLLATQSTLSKGLNSENIVNDPIVIHASATESHDDELNIVAATHSNDEVIDLRN
jgi:hypothetical protein